MLKIVKSGVQISIQDQGRYGYKHLGVPESGAMDSVHAALANSLVGNSPEEAVVEVAFGGVEIEALDDMVIGISGASQSVLVRDKNVSNRAFAMQKGDSLKIEFPAKGVYSYIAIQGGISSDIVLGSRSQYQNITKNATLRSGDIVRAVTGLIPHQLAHSVRLRQNDSFFDQTTFVVTKGPEYWDHLNLFDRYFTINAQSNRQAYMLSEKVPHQPMDDMLTSAVMPGVVQLTPSGVLRVLMRDSQTTGGYPRVICLDDHQVSILSQKRPGDQIMFLSND